ncbi:MAG: Cna B-type domain-containing protein [Clostridia bacterium]|nr:Cna B-type domain-containing protein [Clostridia bacterium]
MFKKFLQRYILVLCSLVFIVAAITSGTLAWQSIGQTAANVLLGINPPICYVQLLKTDQNGEPVPGAEFTLHEVGGEQIGGIYTTDEDGRIILPDKLPKGDYYFEEVTPPVGYTYTLDDAGWPVFFYDFTVEKGDTLLEVKAEDLYIGDQGSLLLHNIVKNENGSPLTDEQLALPFTYHVNFSEDSEEGYTYVIFGGGIREYGEIPGNDGEIPSYMDTKTIRSGETLQLSHGQTAIFYDIPNGVLYNITQDPMPDYRTESTGHQGTIRDNEARAIFINIYAEKEAEPGSLTITKDVAGENADSGVNFNFIAVVGGVEHGFTLRAGQSHTISDLPVGTAYTVYEAAEEGWSSLTERYSGKIASGEEVLLPFVNVPKEDTDETGSLTITKRVNGDSNPDDRFTMEVLFSDSGEYLYTIGGEAFTLSEDNTLTLAAGEMAVFDHIPGGVRYSILETNSAGYIAVTGGISGTIVGGHTAEAVIVNESEQPDEETAVLRITKKLSGEDIPADDWTKEFSFTLTVTNPNPKLGEESLILEETFTLTPDAVYEKEIPVGTVYEVKEADYLTDGYTQTIENGFGIAPVQGETITVTAVNTFHIEDLIETVDISVTKTWDHRNNPDEPPTEITVHLYKVITEEPENAEESEGMETEPEEVRELVDSVTVVPDENGEWLYSFEDLLKYDENNEEIVYVVEEEPVYNYISEMDGYDIHNVYMPTISISGEKTWNHGVNPEEEWPTEITVYLYQNNSTEVFRELTVTPNEHGKWRYTFENLPRYDDDNEEIVYRIGEADVDGYSSTVDGYDLVNIYDRYIIISGKKTWIHKVNNENRPEFIIVNLCVGDSVIEWQEVRADENGEWLYSFPVHPEDKLPKYDENGVEIPYTISEDPVEGYICEVKGYDLYNTYDLSQETIDISGTKTWEHGENPVENYPDSITVLLYADDALIDEQEIRAEDNWEYSFTELPKYNENNQEIDYTIDEVEVENYKKTVIGDDLVNTYDPSPEDETVTISGVKTWDHGNNPNPPEFIKVYLYADGKEADWCIAEEDTGWEYSFEGLPKYNDGGTEVRYTIGEEPIAGYTTEVEGYNLHNRFKDLPYDETIDIIGVKTWDHGDNPEDEWPDSVTVYLLHNGEVADHCIVTAEDEWNYSFTNLPVYDADGQPITYTIAEEPVPEYKTVVSGYNLLNTHESAEIPETITISGEKIWEHRDNPEAKWPQSVTVILYGDGEEIEQKIVTEADSWNYTFENLPKYNKDEEEIRYRIEEKPINDYRTEYEEYDIINIYDPLISIEGEKIWEHRNNPKSEWPDEITVYLYADGERIDRLTVDASDDWRYCFDDLPMYDEDGNEIDYEIEEKSVDDYRTEYSGYDIINIHDPKIMITGTKYWEHRSNPEENWPLSVNVFLYANGEQLDWYTVTEEFDNWTYHFDDLPMYDKYGKEILYEVREEPVDGYKTVIDGYDIFNIHDPMISISGEKVWEHRDNPEDEWPLKITVYLYADGDLLDWRTVTEWENWTYEFGEYPMYDENGNEIRYEIEEDPVEDYSLIRDGYDLINVYDPTTSVTVTKIWEHLGNPEENHPESIDVYLFANNFLFAQTEITAEDDWTYTFDDLPVYDRDGMKIQYTIDEKEVEGYTKVIDGYTIINTYEAKVTISGVKTWDHRDNPMANHPASIIVYLFAGNDLIAQKEVTAADNWSYNFGEYPEYDENGIRIQYSIDESTVEGYTKVVDGYDLYNTYTPTITVSGSKIWEHRDNPVENQPKSLVIYLFADGGLTAQTEISAETGWNYTFHNMPKYNEDGSVIQYTVDERTADGYTKVIDGLTIINTYDPLITVSGTKIWNHGNNPVGERPASVIVYLFANGDLVVQSEITAEDNWTFRFTDLPKYDENGTLIQYTVDERTVIGYTKEISGFNITNTWEEEYYPDTEDTNIPQTGDDSDLMPWILLFVLTSCGFAVVVYVIWKKTRKER